MSSYCKYPSSIKPTFFFQAFFMYQQIPLVYQKPCLKPPWCTTPVSSVDDLGCIHTSSSKPHVCINPLLLSKIPDVSSLLHPNPIGVSILFFQRSLMLYLSNRSGVSIHCFSQRCGVFAHSFIQTPLVSKAISCFNDPWYILISSSNPN